jgi:hypothetical protein
MLVDLRPKGVKGNATEKALGRAHITCNKNGIPFDPEKPMITSASASARPPAPRAASARRSSARSATGSSSLRKLESAGEPEVASNDVGELAMEALRMVDPVGYVRFASVYKDFRDPSDFAQFIEKAALEDEEDLEGE